MYVFKPTTTLFIVLIYFMDVFALIEQIPPPKELSECFQREKQYNKVTVIRGEAINTLCEDSFLMQNRKFNNVKFEPTQKDIDTVNAILKKYILEHRRVKRQTGQIRWRRQRPRRKEVRRLTRGEWRRLAAAFQNIKQNGIYDSIAAIHRGESRLLRAHRGPNFLSWHRILLKVLELSLQDSNRRIRLPYWDSTLDFYVSNPENSVLWTNDFFGECRGDVISGPFANWRLGLDPNETLYRNCGSGGALITKEGVRNVMRADFTRDITDERQILQYLEGWHNGPHVWVDGWLRLLYAAAEDPVFFFHHTFIDYIWYKFRQRQKLRGIDPENDYPPTPNNALHAQNATMDPFYFMTNGDGYLDMWEADYEETPSCNTARPNACRSRHLNCNIGRGRCETRIEPPVQALVAPGGAFEAARDIAPKTLPAGITFKAPFVDRRTASVQQIPQRDFEPVPVNNRAKRSISQDQTFNIDKSYQNSFLLDGVADTSLWAFFPVSVVYQRPPGTIYNSKIVTEGSKVTSSDIYSPSYYDVLRNRMSTSVLATNGKCTSDGSGEAKIYFQSQGINYHGFYKDYVILDGKQAIASSVGYLAMKKPGNESAEAYLSAYDTCGRMCRTTCHVKDSYPPEYVPCPGTVRLSEEYPKMYGKDYGEAVSLLWDFDKSRGVPTMNYDNVFVTFYCDYQPTWPWNF